MLIFIGLVFLATLLIGMPVAFGMGLAASTWILFFEGIEPTILARRFYHSLGSFPLLAIPLFIMIGVLADRTRMTSKLVLWLQMIFGRMRGGMAYINVVASALFSGVSGTAVSDIASMGRVEIQMMVRAGYPPSYAAALTAATSILGPIIPPSVAMIIYALAVGNVSIGALFIAGVIPGVLISLGFIAMAWLTTRRGHYGVLLAPPGMRDLLLQTVRVLPLLVLPLIIIVGIRGGAFTITESAAIGVVYMVVFGFLTTPRLKLRDLYDATIYSAVISAVAGMLLGTGAILAWIFTFNHVTQTLADALLAVTGSGVVFLGLVTIALLVLGTAMDAVPIIVALAPLLAPIARKYGIPDVQFALVFVVTCAIGLVTPPVGICLFMVSGMANISVERLSVAVLPFVICMIAVVGMMIVFPWMTLWLPRVLGF